MQVIEIAKFTDRGVIIYPSFELFNRYREVTTEEKANLKDSSGRGLMSDKQKRSIKAIVNNWVTSLVWYMRTEKIPYKKLPLTFATLTLSSKQLHCDKLIKRACLNEFLIVVKRKYNVNSYLWISEKQENGNIHFHIILDRFIKWEYIRKVWNKSQERLGYVTRFAEKYGHFNPNSTDVKQLRAKKNPSAYITKYITKADFNFQCGYQYGHSKNLKLLKHFSTEIDSETRKIINEAIEQKKTTIYNDEFFSVLSVRSGGIEKIFNESIKNRVQKHYLSQYLEFLQ